MDPKRFYNEQMPQKLGSDYEHARWHSNPFQKAQYGMMREVMRNLALPQAEGARSILEVGPGPGTWTRFFLESNPDARYTLVDISAEMLARAQANLPNGFSISFVESDFLAFAPAEPFDIVFSSRAIEYMPDKVAVAKKIASLLAPSGKAILITKMPKKFFDSVLGRKSSDLHQGQITPQELAKLLRAVGLRVAQIRIATATVPGLKSAFLNRLAFRLLSHIPLIAPLTFFAESYVIIAERA